MVSILAIRLKDQIKTYIGKFPKPGRSRAPRVFLVCGVPLRHVNLHSEALMTWGDNSAEAADLALSILWNHFHGRGDYGRMYYIDLDGSRVLVNKKGEIAFRLHKAFLREVVSRWPKDQPWFYTTADIERWVASHVENGDV